MFILRYLFFIIIGSLLLAAPAMSKLITSEEEFAASEGVAFTWSDARARSVQIFLEYRAPAGAWRRVALGSGFLLSSDGLFVTAYHVMKHCLAPQRHASGLSVRIDCSTARPGVRYVAVNEGKEYPIEIISHLTEVDSTSGKEKHTPDEILKQRDFVIGKLKSDSATGFSFWRLRDSDFSAIDVDNPTADFHLTPLLPPKRVFIAGFPQDGNFVMSEGFLNLTEKHRRGYFAVDMEVYTTSYLESQGLAPDTQWGMRVENHMSGGAVVDPSGYVVGLVVNGNHNTAGILSIENILVTFFSRSGAGGAHPAVLLNPNATPLFLKAESKGGGAPARLVSQGPHAELSFTEEQSSNLEPLPVPGSASFSAPPR